MILSEGHTRCRKRTLRRTHSLPLFSHSVQVEFVSQFRCRTLQPAHWVMFSGWKYQAGHNLTFARVFHPTQSSMEVPSCFWYFDSQALSPQLCVQFDRFVLFVQLTILFGPRRAEEKVNISLISMRLAKFTLLGMHQYVRWRKRRRAGSRGARKVCRPADESGNFAQTRNFPFLSPISARR